MAMLLAADGLPPFRRDELARGRGASFSVKISRICAATPRARNYPAPRKKDNAWKLALENDSMSTRSSDFRPRRQKIEKKKLPKDVSPMLIVDQENILEEEEIVPTPAWNTFAGNCHGVWKGVGAVFSPETAVVEPIGLGKKNEYLYDCRIVSFVEPGVDKKIIDREVLWNLQNPHANETEKKVQVQDELIKQDVAREEEDEEEEEGEGGNIESDNEGSEFAGHALDSSDEVEGVVENLTDSDADFDDNEDDFDGDDDEIDDNEEDFDEDEEELDDYLSEDDNVAGEDAVYESAPDDENVPTYPLPELKAKHFYEGMKDVMERDTIDMEPGLVFFEDGAFSRGPKLLLRPKDDATIARGYFYSPTYKIEQCLVRAGHKRVRICHTLSVNDETDEVEILRVGAFEEEWIGPVDQTSFRESSTTDCKLLSQRPRLHPKDLVGTWKVFEINASVSQQDQSLVYACKEFGRRRRMPTASGQEDPAVVWLPGGLYTFVDLNKAGVLRIGAGWRLDDKTNLVMERDYDPDGNLIEVRAQTEILLSKAVR